MLLSANLISWFSVFNFTKTVKQASDRIFLCASICQKSSQCGIILQSYCTSKKGAIFYASQCTCNPTLTVNLACLTEASVSDRYWTTGLSQLENTELGWCSVLWTVHSLIFNIFWLSSKKYSNLIRHICLSLGNLREVEIWDIYIVFYSYGLKRYVLASLIWLMWGYALGPLEGSALGGDTPDTCKVR